MKYKRCIPFLAVALAITSIGQVRHGHDNTNDEQAKKLLSNGKHSFEELLRGEPGAVANMKKIFQLTGDPNRKLRAASLLTFIKTKEPFYFDYLVQEAERAIRSDMPWPTLYDKDGNKITKRINETDPEFLRWCEKHHTDPADQFFAAYYRIPVPWYYLAGAADPRAYTLLIRGLHSSNPMVVTWAAYGLARLRDTRAIEELIVAARHAPGETRYDVIEALVTFPDVKAQMVADDLVTDKQYLDEMRKRVNRPGYKLVFDY